MSRPRLPSSPSDQQRTSLDRTPENEDLYIMPLQIFLYSLVYTMLVSASIIRYPQLPSPSAKSLFNASDAHLLTVGKTTNETDASGIGDAWANASFPSSSSSAALGAVKISCSPSPYGVPSYLACFNAYGWFLTHEGTASFGDRRNTEQTYDFNLPYRLSSSRRSLVDSVSRRSLM